MALKAVLRIGSICALFTLSVACGPQPARAQASADVNVEGLREVRAKNFQAVFIRPGVNFGAYHKLRVDELELAFHTPDRSQNEFPLGEDQKTRLRAAMAVAFGKELAELRHLELVTDPGPDVLDLNVRLQDVTARSPGTRVGSIGRGAFAIETVGEMTLVLELRDSQSEEVLARAFDRRAVEGAAMLQGENVISTWEGVERLLSRWAARAREGLDRLVGGEY